MSYKLSIGLLAALSFAAVANTARAQQSNKIRRIGYLAAATGLSPFFEAFKLGMRDLGYVEGRNLKIEYRASDDPSKVADLAVDLLKSNVELIVTQGPATWAATHLPPTIPIVFGFSGDPVEAGFVNGLARPGRHLTGMTFLAVDLAGKRVELLKETAPKTARLAILSNRTHPGERSEYNEAQKAATVLKTTLQYLTVTGPNDFETAFDAIVKDHAQAVLTFPDAVTLVHRARIAEFLIQRRLPSIFGWREYVDAGGLMSYGPNLNDSFRRLTVYVDRILKGNKPADLPVEQSTKFEFVINLKTAKQIGLTIPPNVLVRADRVIR